MAEKIEKEIGKNGTENVEGKIGLVSKEIGQNKNFKVRGMPKVLENYFEGSPGGNKGTQRGKIGTQGGPIFFFFSSKEANIWKFGGESKPQNEETGQDFWE